MAFDVAGTAALGDGFVAGSHLRDERGHRLGVGGELGVTGSEVRREHRPDGRRRRRRTSGHFSTAHDGGRFSMKAAIPSAASGPANSSAERADIAA